MASKLFFKYLYNFKHIIVIIAYFSLKEHCFRVHYQQIKEGNKLYLFLISGDGKVTAQEFGKKWMGVS